MAETKTVKTALGELEFDKKNNRYIMSTPQLYAKLEEKGLANPKEVLDTVKAAKDALLQEMAHFVSDKAKETMKDTYIVAGKMPHRFEAATIIEKEVNVPGRDGQPTTRKTIYGATSAKQIEKTPGFIKNDEHLKENSSKIEAEWLKVNGNKIKYA